MSKHVPDSVHSNTTPDEGPQPPCFLQWRGHRYDLPKHRWHVIWLMWGINCLEIEAVCEAVWGDYEVEDSTIRATISHVNDDLEKADIPWRLHQKGGYLIKQPAHRATLPQFSRSATSRG